MPQAIPAIATFIASKAAIAILIKTILINVAIGALTRKRPPKTFAPAVNVTIKNTIENRRMIFGRRRAGGVFVFYATLSSGANPTRDLLLYVVVYAGHQCCAMTDMWIDTERIPDADINPTTGHVSTAKFNNTLNIKKYLGTSAQTVDPYLDGAFAEWTSNHRLRGCTYARIYMVRSETAYPNGAPQSVTALIDGAPMYDPRLDSTNGGSGSQTRSDPSTWTNTYPAIGNPALVARWYLTGGSVINDLTARLVRYGLREDDARILDSYTRAAANICDESISGANAPPSGAQTRYSCDVEVSTGETRREILGQILETMAGTMTYVNGKYRIYAGDYDSPIHTLTQDDCRGDIEVDDTTGHRERYNKVSAVFFDDSNQYVEATTLFRTDAAYVTQDHGEEIEREINIPGCINQYRAQRLAEIELRKSRMMRIVKVRGGRDLMRIAQNETFTLSHSRWSWTSRVFRCIERQLEFDGDEVIVVITARREDSGVWADMLTADYTTGESDTDVFENDGPDAPTNLSITPLPGALQFTITLPTFFKAGSIVELWEYTANTPFASATKIWEGETTSYTKTGDTPAAKYYWTRIRGPHATTSDTYPSGNGLSGQALAPVTPNSLTLTAIPNGIVAQWAAATEAAAGTVWELYQHTASTPFASATKIWEGTALSYTIEGETPTAKYYWVRARLSGQNSATYPATTGQSGQALAPVAPNSLTLTGVAGAIVASWTSATQAAAGTVWELWEYTASTPFASATKIWEGTALNYTIVGDTPTAKYYWVRARLSGQNSATYPASTGATGLALSPVAPTGLTLTGFPTSIKAVVGGTFAQGTIIEIWEYTANTPFASATKVTEGELYVLSIPVRDTTTRYYWARARLSGQTSATFPSGNGTAGTADLTQTTDIAANGVTTLSQGFTAGIVSPRSAGAPPKYSDFAHYVTVTPAVDCQLIVTCNFEAQATDAEGDWDSDYNVHSRVIEDGSLSVVAAGQQVLVSTTRGAHVAKYVLSVTGGVAIRCGLWVAITASITGLGIDFWNVNITVEQVKR